MISIAKEQVITITSDEVLGYLKELDDDDEFDDVELDAATLSAIYGGGRGGTGNYTTNHGDAVLVCVQCVSGFLEGTSDGQTGTF